MIKEKIEQNVIQWKSNFGNSYIERNPLTKKNLEIRINMWKTLFSSLNLKDINSALEVGCNVGLNLKAISKLHKCELFGVEPNEKAREIVLKNKICSNHNLHDGIAEKLNFKSETIDLTFTNGVLIHIPKDRLIKSMNEIFRVTKKYIICVEYFSDKSEEVKYGDEEVLLIKRDYGSLWLDNFKNLKLIDYGFFWKKATKLDNTTWWIFEKKT